MPAKEFSKKFQFNVLNLMLTDPEFASEFTDILQPEYFDNVYVFKFYSLFRDFFIKYNKIPEMISMLQLCYESDIKDNGDLNKDKLLEFVRFIYKRKIEDKNFIIDWTRQFVQTQAFKSFVLECSEKISEGQDSNQNIMLMRDKMDKVINIASDLKNLGSVYLDEKDIKKRIKLREGGIRRDSVTTGIPYFDFLLEGGICKGELLTILGPSSRGKSMVAINIGAAILLSQKTLFHYSSELSEDFIGNRYDSRLSGINYHSMSKNGNIIFEKLLELKKKNKDNIIIKYLPYNKGTVVDIKSHIAFIKRTKGISPDAIIVDSGDNMQPAYAKFKEKRHTQSQIFYELRFALAQELGVPVIATTQTNRAALKKEVVDMTDIGEDFSKAQVSDIIPALCQTEEEEEKDVQGFQRMRFFLTKVRDSEDHKIIYLKVNKAKMLFEWDKITQLTNSSPHDIKKFKEWKDSQNSLQLMDKIKQLRKEN